MSVPSIGIAYRVLTVVQRTEEGSPARKVILKKGEQPAEVPQFAPGDKVVKAEIIGGDAEEKTLLEKMKIVKWEFSEENPNWPFFMELIQSLSPEAKVRLTLSDDRIAELPLVEDPDAFVADRGLVCTYGTFIDRADNWAQAFVIGKRATGESLYQVYGFLRGLGTGQISIFGLGGPVTIAGAAGSAASEGLAELLYFLTVLSANLAVINFLPIPLLDGGHMVFLAIEGIFRRPVSEKVVVAFHYAGFVFIISLMLFVLSLDLGIIARPH
jgi:regulator of sigma E protease